MNGLRLRNRSGGLRWWSIFKIRTTKSGTHIRNGETWTCSVPCQRRRLEMEYDLQQIWEETVSNNYKAYAILIPNKQNKWLVFWCWTASKEEIEPPAPGHIILPVSDILAR